MGLYSVAERSDATSLRSRSERRLPRRSPKGEGGASIPASFGSASQFRCHAGAGLGRGPVQLLCVQLLVTFEIAKVLDSVPARKENR